MSSLVLKGRFRKEIEEKEQSYLRRQVTMCKTIIKCVCTLANIFGDCMHEIRISHLFIFSRSNSRKTVIFQLQNKTKIKFKTKMNISTFVQGKRNAYSGYNSIKLQNRNINIRNGESSVNMLLHVTLYKF